MVTTLGKPLGHPLSVPVPGGRLAVWSRGSGHPVVLLHGGTGTAAHDWSHIVSELEHEAHVIAMDLRGHGMSSAPVTDLGLTRFGLDAVQVMRSLGVPRAVIVGFSVGANAVLDLLARQPWLAHAAIVIGASARGRPERVEEIMGGPWPTELRRLYHDVADGDLEYWRDIRAALARDWADNVRFLENGLDGVRCPVTVVHGADDPIVLPEQAERITGLLPDAQLVEVPDAGHQVHREQPEAFLAVIRRVLAEL